MELNDTGRQNEQHDIKEYLLHARWILREASNHSLRIFTVHDPVRKGVKYASREKYVANYSRSMIGLTRLDKIRYIATTHLLFRVLQKSLRSADLLC